MGTPLPYQFDNEFELDFDFLQTVPYSDVVGRG